MTIVTLGVAAAGACMALWLRPSRVLLAFLAVLCLYPQYLTIQVGTVDFTVGRIVILVVLARLVFSPGIVSNFRINLIDSMVVAAWAAGAFALTMNAPIERVIEREMGTFFDSSAVYFAARLSITSRDDFIYLIKALIVMAIPLAFMGLYQSWTGVNPYGFMRAYGTRNIIEQPMFVRYGLYRADAAFNLHIAFGMFFSFLFAMSIGLWRHVQWSTPVKLTVVTIMLAGMFSSMSSAPFFAIVISTALIAMYPYRRHAAYFGLALMLLIVAIELYSNRHFPQVLGRVAFSSKSTNYRVELFKEAFSGGMDGHWTFGYGYVGIGPGTDNTNFDWKHKDLLNMYLARLVRTGLVGMIPFMVLTILPYFRLRRGYQRVPNEDEGWLIWCLMAGLVGWHVALMTVNVLYQIVPLYWMVLAIATNIPMFYAAAVPVWMRRPVYQAPRPQRTS